MSDIVTTILYWLLNTTIILGGLFYAHDVLQEKRKATSGVILFVSGIAWHVFRGINEYKNGSCRELGESKNWLFIANQCIPYMDYDIILAQVAIFSGFFVFIVLVVKSYGRYQS